MALLLYNGDITTDGTEQNLFSVTSTKHYASWIYLDSLIDTDSIRVRVYVYDVQDLTERKYIDTTISNAQESPAYFIPFIPAVQYRVSVTRTSLINRTISWQRAEA